MATKKDKKTSPLDGAAQMGIDDFTPEFVDAVYDEFSTAGKEKRDPKARRRRRIIDAATRLFIAQGYRKTTIDEIAREAGVAKGTIYLYAKNKGELLFEAITNEKMSQRDAQMKVLDPSRSPHDRMRSLIVGALVVTQKMPLMSKLMTGDREFLYALEGVDPDIKKNLEAARHHFPADLIEAFAPGALSEEEKANRARVIAALGLFSTLIGDPVVRQGLSIEEFAETYADIILYGLTGRATPAPNPPTSANQ